MHLVDGHRRPEGLARPARRHPRLVVPHVAVEPRDRRRRARAGGLEGEGQGIGLEHRGPTRPGQDLELVASALGDARHEQLPHAVARVQPHGVTAPVPPVPVADHAHPAGVGRPHREDHAVHAEELGGMGSELVEHAVVGALPEEMPVVVAQGRREPVGIVQLGAAAVGPGYAEPVPAGRWIARAAGERGLPEAARIEQPEGAGPVAREPDQSTDRAPGTSARMRSVPSASRWGPSTENGSACSPTTSARTASGASITPRFPRGREGHRKPAENAPPSPGRARRPLRRWPAAAR